MVEILASNARDEGEISETGISYSAVPTFRGPRYWGKVGTGLREVNILRKLEECRVSKARDVGVGVGGEKGSSKRHMK
jgi:hypothetical protein